MVAAMAAAPRWARRSTVSTTASAHCRLPAPRGRTVPLASVTYSVWPPASETTTGRPLVMASAAETKKLSPRVGPMKTSARASSARTP